MVSVEFLTLSFSLLLYHTMWQSHFSAKANDDNTAVIIKRIILCAKVSSVINLSWHSQQDLTPGFFQRMQITLQQKQRKFDVHRLICIGTFFAQSASIEFIMSRSCQSVRILYPRNLSSDYDEVWYWRLHQKLLSEFYFGLYQFNITRDFRGAEIGLTNHLKTANYTEILTWQNIAYSSLMPTTFIWWIYWKSKTIMKWTEEFYMVTRCSKINDHQGQWNIQNRKNTFGKL
jgi:hypothetical protein